MIARVLERRQVLRNACLLHISGSLNGYYSFVAATLGIQDFVSLRRMVSGSLYSEHVLPTMDRMESSQYVGSRLVPFHDGFHPGAYLGLKR